MQTVTENGGYAAAVLWSADSLYIPAAVSVLLSEPSTHVQCAYNVLFMAYKSLQKLFHNLVTSTHELCNFQTTPLSISHGK